MELLLSANIHQGNDLFSVYSRGRQCAFMRQVAYCILHYISLDGSSRLTEMLSC